MKRIILGIAFACLCILSVQAQPKRPFQERIESMRVAFVTDQLRLSPEESGKFWPVYNEFKEKEKNIRESYAHPTDFATMTDEQAEKMVLDGFEREERLLKLKREYYDQLKKVIPVRKIAMINQVERKFKERLLEEMQRHRQNRNRPGGGK